MTLTETRPADTRAHVDATIRFTDPASAGAVLHTQDHESSTFALQPKTVRISNARAEAGRLSFEANGFTMLRAPFETGWFDKDAVQAHYYPEAARIVRELTGASDVIVFLDLIRSSAREEGVEVANNAHVDFDEPSVHGWVRMFRPADAERLLKKRILNINLWRPLRPIEQMPLALCDASSVDRGDLVRTIIGSKPGEPDTGFAGYNLAYNPSQRWYWFPDMQPGEVLAFKLYDSDQSRPHLTAHTAFADPTSSPDAPPRLSHEVRTIAFLD
jgi:hypothetical protein